MNSLLNREFLQIEKTLLFLHIPKVGGTSLHKILEKQYPNVKHFRVFEGSNINKIDQLKGLSTEEKEGIGVIRGHMNFGLHEFLPKPVNYITMLRDPVYRVISHYYWIKRNSEHFLYKDCISMSLEDFVSSKITTEIDNSQTRILAGVADVAPILIPLKKEQAKIPFGECTNEILEKAKKNLNSFAVVGLTERFDESLILLKRILGWEHPPLYLKQNVSPTRLPKEDLPGEVLALIEKYNELDIELYRYATNLFEEKINHQDASFEEELKDFKLLNKSYQEQQGFQQEHH